MKVVAISGHRQRDCAASPDFLSWRHVAGLVGEVSCHWAGPRLDLRESGFRVRRRPRGGRFRDCVWLVSTVRAAVADARTGDEAVVNGGDPMGWLVGYVVARLSQRHLTLDLHADFTRLPAASVGHLRAALLRRVPVALARRADAVRVVSSTTLADLRAHGVNAVLIPPRLGPSWGAHDIRTRDPLADPLDVRVVTVGRLVASKGFDLLLESFARLRPEQAALGRRLSLTFVGDGPLAHELRQRADELGLLDSVRFAGFLAPESVQELLLESDILVISSRDEGTPRTLLEGVAAGLPVVATRVGGIPDASSDLLSVVLCAPDARSLTEGLAEVLADPPTPYNLLRSREMVLERYDFGANLAAVAAHLSGGV